METKPWPNGLVVVDKPLGASSMDVVRRVRWSARQVEGVTKKSVKVGHAGTLDPLATGVVICCLGRATKQVDQLMNLTKVYEATIDLSAFTNTEDREGERQEVDVPVPPGRSAIDKAIINFIGEIEQVPPAFSAIHINGQRAYKLARRGDAVELPGRVVRVDAIEVLDYAWPSLTVCITCGKGTYIRSLARDLGKALGTGGHLASLRRTAVGHYTVSEALPLDHFRQPLLQEDVREILAVNNPC